MKKMKRMLIALALLLVSYVATAQSFVNGSDSMKVSTDTLALDTTSVEQEEIITINVWDALIDAIIYVESRGNEKAYNKDGKCAGILQITPVLVAEVNRLMRAFGKKATYTLEDRFNKEKSIEMFNIIQDFYNKEKDIEKAIRLWNGGPGYKVRSTQSYYEKVMAEHKRIMDL